MLIIIRRHFWVLGLAAVAACVLLGYRGAVQLVAAEEPPPAFAEPPAAPRVARVAPRSKDGSALVDRNIFCSSCAPPVADGGPVTEGDGIPLTALPVSLLATSLAAEPADSFATLRDTGSGQQGAYGVGDRFPGAGAIEAIGGTSVVFHNPGTNRRERAVLAGDVAAEASPAPVAKGPATGGYADRVRAVGEHRYEVDAGLMKQLTDNPMQIKGVRFAPFMKDGAIRGFRLSYARPDSLATTLGMRRGDVITGINGYELNDADTMLELYTKLRNQTSFRATVERGGKPIELRYDVR